VWAGASVELAGQLLTAPRELVLLASLSLAFDGPRENRQ